jgi:hypothetical protein
LSFGGKAGDVEHASAVAKAELLGSATGSASLVMLGPVRVSYSNFLIPEIREKDGTSIIFIHRKQMKMRSCI